jgi:predicted PurR-regulated permease PerM
LIIFLLSGFIIIVPFLVSRGTQVLQSVTVHVQNIQTDILTQGIDAYVRGLKWLPDFLNDDILNYITHTNSASLIQTVTENLGNIVNLSSSYLKIIGEYAVNIFGSIFTLAGKGIILFTLSVFFSLSHFEVKYGLKYVFRKIPHSKEKVEEVYTGISSRLRSQLFLCVFIGLTSYLGLWILSWAGIDLPQKGVLALLAGLFEIIPYLGPFLGALPAAAYALLLFGFPGLLWVIVVYTIMQQLEEKLFVPVIMSKTLGVNPLLVFVCMLFGGMIMGIFGIVLAVPIAVIFSIVFKLPEERKSEESHLAEKKEEEKSAKKPLLKAISVRKRKE